jgi:hypothetical protein
MTARHPTIADEILRTIQARGPQDLDDLTKVVVDAGLTRAKDPRRAVTAAIDIHPAFLRDWDGRWCSIDDQLNGTIFTRRPTPLELYYGVILMVEDLHLVERLAMRGRPHIGGGEVHLDYAGDFFDLDEPDGPEDDSDTEGFRDDDELGRYDADRAALDEMRYLRLLDGPPGWLPSVRVDGLIGITFRDGAIEAVALDRRDVRGPQVGLAGSRIVALARRFIGPDPSWFGPPAVTIEELLELVATEAPEILRRPLPPLSEVIERAGLEVVGGMVGHLGTDWEAIELAPPVTPQEAWGFDPPDTPA